MPFRRVVRRPDQIADFSDCAAVDCWYCGEHSVLVHFANRPDGRIAPGVAQRMQSGTGSTQSRRRTSYSLNDACSCAFVREQALGDESEEIMTHRLAQNLDIGRLLIVAA